MCRPRSSASKEKFLANLRLVKTLYSPETRGGAAPPPGLRRALTMWWQTQDMNDAFAAAFDSLPVSVGEFAWAASPRRDSTTGRRPAAFPYRGPATATGWGDVPALAPLSLNVVVRNERKAYDFGIRCEGGLALNCGTLTFHGKSDTPWKDSLEWEAFDQSGKLLASAKTKPAVLGADGDTAVAILWAGSSAPFSEKKELPLGPVFGFVDRWASILALEKDSLDRDRNASLCGFRGAPHRQQGAQGRDPQLPGRPGSGRRRRRRRHASPLPSSRRRACWGFPPIGSSSGPWTECSCFVSPDWPAGCAPRWRLFDLHGRRLGDWMLTSGAGALRWNPSGIARGGLFLLKIEVAGLSATKRIAL